MSKKEVINENYLEKIPVRNKNITWKQDDENKVTLEIENTGDSEINKINDYLQNCAIKQFFLYLKL